MNVKVVRSTTVRPSEPTPNGRIWCTNIDLVAPRKYARILYFFRWDGSTDFFDRDSMVRSLSRTLVAFYPLAGRMGRDSSGRIEVVCNAHGVAFLEAESSTTTVEDLGDFAPTGDFMGLVPHVSDEEGSDLAHVPLYLVQLTRFKCKGVSLGITVSHELLDGASATHFLTSWSEVLQGQNISVPPVFDRRLLSARKPPNPSFTHPEYFVPQPCNRPKATSQPPIAEIFKLNPHHVDLLRTNHPKDCKYSTTTVVAAHVWKCMCIARGLTDDHQTTRMYITTNGRPRFRPPLPPGYFGNVLFLSAPTATVGEVVGGREADLGAKMDAALKRTDDEYMRSAVDYLELQPDVAALARGPHTFASPHVGLTSWLQLPVTAVDFGWGRAVAAVPVSFWFEGLVFLLGSAAGDGSVSVLTALRPEFMARFRIAMYEFRRQAKL